MLRDRARERVRERIDEAATSSPPVKSGARSARTTTRADPKFDAQAEEAIPAEVRMISGCHDTQTSADVGNVATFQLPDAAGKAGGALTSAMLSVIYKEEKPSVKGLTFVDVFLRARKVVKAKGFEQIPQLSSSRNINVNQPFDLMSNKHGSKGSRYAVLIGINYTKHKQGQLSGCWNDVHNIKKYIMDVGKFKSSNITILLDDGKATSPTRANIMKELDHLCKKCKPGDTGFVHYSGHGGRVKDTTGKDSSGYNSTLCPVDYDRAGQILDKELYEHLVCSMPKGTSLTCLMDCCHSGTVLDLPYNFVADGEQTEMKPQKNFPFLNLLAMRRAMREAGVGRLRDLQDDDKRDKVIHALEKGSGDRAVEGVRRDFESTLGVGARARQERRQGRRGR